MDFGSDFVFVKKSELSDSETEISEGELEEGLESRLKKQTKFPLKVKNEDVDSEAESESLSRSRSEESGSESQSGSDSDGSDDADDEAEEQQKSEDKSGSTTKARSRSFESLWSVFRRKKPNTDNNQIKANNQIISTKKGKEKEKQNEKEQAPKKRSRRHKRAKKQAPILASASPPPPLPTTTTTTTSSTTKKKIKKIRKVDTNMISVKLGTLADHSMAYATGDPIVCRQCEAIFTITSKLSSPTTTSTTDTPEPSDQQIWVCEFCGHHNHVFVEPEEIPQVESVDYVLEGNAPSPSTPSATTNAPPYLIFCIDVSGSMCVTTEVKGKFEMKGRNRRDEFDGLDIQGSQYLPREKRNVTYVSRLQSVQTAVSEQLSRLKQENPTMIVGLVTFGSEITIIGDGCYNNNSSNDNNNNNNNDENNKNKNKNKKNKKKGEENEEEVEKQRQKEMMIVITGDKLKSYSELKRIGESSSVRDRFTRCIHDSQLSLNSLLCQLNESGQTALGPALLLAMSVAQERKGSKVIVCTDGRSNVGLGSLDDESSPVHQNNSHTQQEKENNPYWNEETNRDAFYQSLIDLFNISSCCSSICPSLFNFSRIISKSLISLFSLKRCLLLSTYFFILFLRICFGLALYDASNLLIAVRIS